MTDSDMIVANQYRTHSCNGLSAQEINESVNLSGWVHRIRDHGGLLFVDLRDHYGITQCVVDPDSDAFAAAESLRPECCIKISGEVRARDQEAINDQLATGKIEVFIRRLEILGPIEDLPLPVFGEPEYPEDTRLTYRFLDLRRETLHQNIILRSKIIAAIRDAMQNKAFNEFQTPILTASSPEGARDYLIASRVHPGQFYALPQAPQQFKQLLMIAGFDRYFQIAPCFRDEDPRADRLPGEFYQLDVEMSFVEQEDILAIMEEVVGQIFSRFAGDKAVPMPFQRISYKDALKKYASDKPDLRNPIQMSDASATFHNGGFKLFANMLASDDEAEIRAIPAPGGGSRAFCDRINSWAQSVGQPGLGYIFFRKSEGDDGATEAAGPIARNLGPERTELLRAQLGLKEGDAVFFCGGRARDFEPFAATARTKIASELQLIDPNSFALAWIIDFPMYEWNEEESRFDFSHNPFSMPKGGLEALTHTDPKFITAHQYDLVCNGYEIASGAIRNHRPEIMRRAFEIAGYGADDLQERFSGMYRALHYGAPPHGGMAAGIDRIVMLLAGAVNLREIMPFPMNQQARDLLMGAPSAAAPSQLRELHLRLIPTDKK